MMSAFSRVSIFVNPVAGDGRGEKVFKEITELKIENRMIGGAIIALEKTSQSNRDDEQKIKTAANHSDLIMVFGGDGTLHKVVNSLIPLSYEKGIALFPLGTGNDLLKSLGFEFGSVKTFIEKIINSPQKKELNIYRINDKVYFMNYLSFGFDARIVHAYQNAVVTTSKKKIYKKSRIDKLLLWLSAGIAGLLSSQKKIEVKGESQSFVSIIFNGIGRYAGGATFPGGECKEGHIKLLRLANKASFIKLVLNRPPINRFLPFTIKTNDIQLPHEISFASPTDIQIDGESYSNEFGEVTDFRIKQACKLEIYG